MIERKPYVEPELEVTQVEFVIEDYEVMESLKDSF
jgi:hypothetical protein